MPHYTEDTGLKCLTLQLEICLWEEKTYSHGFLFFWVVALGIERVVMKNWTRALKLKLRSSSPGKSGTGIQNFMFLNKRSPLRKFSTCFTEKKTKS